MKHLLHLVIRQVSSLLSMDPAEGLPLTSGVGIRGRSEFVRNRTQKVREVIEKRRPLPLLRRGHLLPYLLLPQAQDFR